MSSRRASSRTLWRRFTLGTGPLKRTSDRVEFLSRIVLVVVLLAAVPAGELAGAAVYSGMQAMAQEQAATRAEVQATLLADAPGGRTYVTPDVPTRATWIGPDGIDHTGTVTAPAGALAGTTVIAWVDPEGRIVPAPLTRGDAVSDGIVVGALTIIGVAVAGMGGHAVVLRLLARRRVRRWEDGWAQVEPLWVTRFR